jgi:hypothetical protein
VANAGMRGRPIAPLVLSPQGRALCVLKTSSRFYLVPESAKLAR